MPQYDVIIIGAGPVGLCMAALLMRAGLSVLVLEKQDQKNVTNPSYDGREIALTHFSKKILDRAGIWDHLNPTHISLIKDAKVLNKNFDHPLFFDHRKSGKDHLGFLISNHYIRRAAYDTVRANPHIDIRFNADVAGIEFDEFNNIIALKNGDRLKTKLVIAADSRFSATRRMAGIVTNLHDFGRTCIVCRVKLDCDHDETAYECFFYDRTLAVLPLNGRFCSVVITIATQDDHQILGLSADEFSRDITQRMEGRFGNMTLDTELFPYPLVGSYAQKFTAARYALLGDAAVGMHPVTAHGFNFGLRGADTLSREVLCAHSLGLDIGTTDVLSRYDRAHRHATWPLYQATNSLVTLFTSTAPLARLARHGLLKLGRALPPAQKLIMNQLTEAAS